MGRPKGIPIPKDEIERRFSTYRKNRLNEAKPKYFGDQIIKCTNYKSVIQWDLLESRFHTGKIRRCVPIICRKCHLTRRASLDNVRKQLRKPYFSGLCQTCLKEMSWLEKGRPRPEKRKITNHGYIKIYVPENPMADKRGEVYEHRVVMAKKLGRMLEPWETVHHKDGNKNNNSPENLELFPNKEHRTITSLQSEIKRLKNLLKIHNIPFQDS